MVWVWGAVGSTTCVEESDIALLCGGEVVGEEMMLLFRGRKRGSRLTLMKQRCGGRRERHKQTREIEK